MVPKKAVWLVGRLLLLFVKMSRELKTHFVQIASISTLCKNSASLFGQRLESSHIPQKCA